MSRSTYHLVPEARNDLLGILDHIAGDSIDSALRVHERFMKVFGLLSRHPDVGHLRSDLTTRPVRFIPVYSYLVIYLADTTPVQIIRVLGQAQDIEAILKEKRPGQ